MSLHIDKLIEQVRSCKKLSLDDTIALCFYVTEILLEEPTVLELQPNVIICGDIHGQFHDLLKLFEQGGQLDNTDASYLFLGDFVDRGLHSLETITLLLLYKAKYRDQIYLLRGNHETRAISSAYGFYDECQRHYGTTLPWLKFMEVFDVLALAAVVGNEYFCVHGGISPESKVLDKIKTLQRLVEVPTTGLASDLLWSDPVEGTGEFHLSPRGAGYEFGSTATDQFLHLTNLKMIVRAHQLVLEGFDKLHNNQVVTIWSAPNYCYRCGNKAAIMKIRQDRVLDPEYITFDEAEESKKIAENLPRPSFFM
ncbi:hypothetical protein RCL1_005437 [Eukaryota sp. TZLM3-RCL]